MPRTSLPVDVVLDELNAALEKSGCVVLQAAPGAGKSTRIPLALLAANWLGDQRILVLEPRRLAARAVARRMAWSLGEEIGRTIGYRMRGDTRVSSSTRVEVVTEGVLTRMLLADPSLDGIGLVIFDEFHERSIHGDFGLALSLQSQELLRPDLRILVMSATLDTAGISGTLRGAPVISSPSRSFPIDIRYFAQRDGIGVESAVASMIRQSLATDDGSVLAFLPGTAEIRRCQALLEGDSLPADVRLAPLYGDLALEAQDAAIRPAMAGERKVVLATSIAETSLTIEGVRVVVDSGLSRVSRFSPRTGMARLETVRVTRAAADQRAGRAGRTSPGICYRLWPEEEQLGMLERARPEILEADLTPLALDLALAGVQEPDELRWIDAPPPPALEHARELLRALGAIDTVSRRLTAHGRDIGRLGVHPRIAHMLHTAASVGAGATACVVAVLLEERDILRRSGHDRDPDLQLRFDLVADRSRDVPRAVTARVSALRSLMRIAPLETVDAARLGECVAMAYPDRIAQRRSAAGRYRLRNGTGAMLSGHGSLWRDEFIAVAELDGRRPDAMIFLAASLGRETIVSLFEQDVEVEEVIEWNAAESTVVATRREMLGALILDERRIVDPSPEQVSAALLEAIRRKDGIALRWSDTAIQLRERVAFLRARDSRWPDWSDSALDASLAEWLAPHLSGMRRRTDVERLPLHELLLESLNWERRRDLDRLAPTHITVPTGSRIHVDYAMVDAPRIAVRLQELFGLADSPTIADGAFRLTIELLSPAQRPVQVTNDLAGFWANSYFEVRRELRGRYPRHEWPEDPLHATPTRRAKPRA